jgi:hypothetical protein
LSDAEGLQTALLDLAPQRITGARFRQAGSGEPQVRSVQIDFVKRLWAHPCK